MHSILIAFEKPPADEYGPDWKWDEFVGKLSTLTSSNKENRLLGERCVMLAIDQNLKVLHDVLNLARGLAYSYTILCDRPAWHAGKA